MSKAISVRLDDDAERALRALEASDLECLESGSAEKRAELIAQRLAEWKSAANAF